MALNIFVPFSKKKSMNLYIKPAFIGLILIITSACRKNNTFDSEINKIYKHALNNHRTLRDSTAYFLSACLKYDTLQISDLSKARILHIKGLDYETKLKYDSAGITFSNAASLLDNHSLKATLLLRSAVDALKMQDYEKYNHIMAAAEKLANKLNEPIHHAAFQANKGEYYIEIDNYEKAIPFFTKADSILKANNVLRGRDHYQYRVGLAYRRLSKFPLAFEHVNKSISLANQGNNTYSLTISLLDISRMYRTAQRYEEALNWEKKHLDLAYEHKNMEQIQRGLENMGIIYAEKKDWETAETYFKKSLEKAIEINKPASVGDALSNTGNFYYRRGDYKNAHRYYIKSYEYRKKHYNKPVAILSSLFHLGDVDLLNQNFISSENNLKRAVFLADSTNQIGWAVTASKRLVELYKKTGDYKNQTKALQQYVDFKDRWNSEVQNTNFNKLSLQYEKKHNEAIIARQADQLKINRLLLITISVSLILAISITVFIFIHKAARLKAFKAIYRQQVLVNDQKRVIKSLLKGVNTTKPINSENELLSRLVELLEKHEVYKNQDISLELVANKLATNITYVSKLVNNEFNCNFNTLINRYRINYCKICIRNNDAKVPMKSIGLNAGFKSQSTFYATFKEFIGMTPLQYAKISKMEIKRNTNKHHA